MAQFPVSMTGFSLQPQSSELYIFSPYFVLWISYAIASYIRLHHHFDANPFLGGGKTYSSNDPPDNNG